MQCLGFRVLGRERESAREKKRAVLKIKYLWILKRSEDNSWHYKWNGVQFVGSKIRLHHHDKSHCTQCLHSSYDLLQRSWTKCKVKGVGADQYLALEQTPIQDSWVLTIARARQWVCETQSCIICPHQCLKPFSRSWGCHTMNTKMGAFSM